ncbi:hypothetical protein [Labrys sp. 22185]|uniref:hypothetical protein n=1 Tax=Labrys sp. 22185 TaxID=3453888 RepID=UPI003F8430D9
MTDPFGKLSEIPTKTARPSKDMDVLAQRAALEQGFHVQSSAPVPVRTFRPASRGPMTNKTIRMTIADWNAFQEYCERNRLKAGEGFGELVRHVVRDGGDD